MSGNTSKDLDQDRRIDQVDDRAGERRGAAPANHTDSDAHPLRRAPERLARVSEESESMRRMLWARVNQEIARLGATSSPRPTPSPVMPGGLRPAGGYRRQVRPRPDL